MYITEIFPPASLGHIWNLLSTGNKLFQVISYRKIETVLLRKKNKIFLKIQIKKIHCDVQSYCNLCEDKATEAKRFSLKSKGRAWSHVFRSRKKK